MRSAALIHNPGSGQQRDRFHSVTRMVDALRLRGIAATPQITTGPTDAIRLTTAAVQAGTDMVIVHGGDGTINETMQVLVGTSTPLAVWPGGTSNVLARELALPGGIDLLAQIIAAGRTRRVSVGRAGERYFLLMAGVGLDADVVRAVHPGLKRLTGESAYWMAGLRQLTDWNPIQFLIETEGAQHGATFAVVANAASYGGGLRFAPEASMDDDLLDVVLFDSTQRHRFARYLAAAFTGSHLGMDGVTYLKARRVVAHGPDSRFVHVDGELLGPLPVSFECVPAALSLVVP
ncbi:MAG TPA: diacylglycerol kinase family protein [Candidatus Nitrosotalea sp.]|nr:diacylglycerol kinase family protein [Candidatus Nitrosotalea sp.]